MSCKPWSVGLFSFGLCLYFLVQLDPFGSHHSAQEEVLALSRAVAWALARLGQEESQDLFLWQQEPVKKSKFEDIKPVYTSLESNSTKILLVASYRTGSTYFGQLLNQYPGVFYLYEPLHYLQTLPNQSISPVNIIKALFQCNISDPLVNGFVEHMVKASHGFILRENQRLSNVCKAIWPRKALCTYPTLFQRLCQLHPITLIKTVRLTMDWIRILLQDSDLSGLKVIMLTRDPRGFMNSRLKLNWCVSDCNDLDESCQRLQSDTLAYEELKNDFPSRIKAIRFEDLVQDPKGVMRSLITFLDLEPSKAIEGYLDQSKVDSSRISQAWRTSLSMEKIQLIQKTCSEPMTRLGYLLFDDEKQVRNLNLPFVSSKPTLT